jgi:hypothetical protein
MAADTLAGRPFYGLVAPSLTMFLVVLNILLLMKWVDCVYAKKKWKMGLKINNATKEMMIYII